MNTAEQRIWAVIPAAGVGARMRSHVPKQYLPLLDKTVIEHTLEIFISHRAVAGIVVAISPNDAYWSDLNINDERIQVVDGGEERCLSVQNCLTHLLEHTDKDDWVMVHDAARPCLRHADIDRLIKVVIEKDTGGLLAMPVSDTMKQSDEHGYVEQTLDRSKLWHAQTPQMYRLGQLSQALHSAQVSGQVVTDEASAIELCGEQSLLVEGSSDNIKITHPQDLQLAAFFLQHSLQPDEVINDELDGLVADDG